MRPATGKAETIAAAAALAGRALLVAIFVLESWIKAKGYDAALGYMQRFGVPGLLLPPALLVEI